MCKEYQRHNPLHFLTDTVWLVAEVGLQQRAIASLQSMQHVSTVFMISEAKSHGVTVIQQRCITTRFFHESTWEMREIGVFRNCVKLFEHAPSMSGPQFQKDLVFLSILKLHETVEEYFQYINILRIS